MRVTGHSLFNTNKMRRSVDDRPVLIVESDADLSVLGAHIEKSRVVVSLACGRATAIAAARLHQDAGDKWVAALVDRDVRTEAVPDNVFTTSGYDLEADLFYCDAELTARFIYRHLLHEQNAASLSHQDAESCVADCVEIASAVGAARLAAVEMGKSVSFAGLPIHEVVQRSKGRTLIAGAVEIACLRAGQPHDTASITARAEQVLAEQDAAALCCGHDLLGVARYLIGAVTGKAPARREFDRGFHSLATCEMLPRLQVHRTLDQWHRALTSETMWDCA